MSTLLNIKRYLRKYISEETDFDNPNLVDDEFKRNLIDCFMGYRDSNNTIKQITQFTIFFREINASLPKEKINKFWVYIAGLLLNDINQTSRASLHAGGFLRKVSKAESDVLLFRTIMHTQLFGYGLAYMAVNYPDNWHGWSINIHACLNHLVEQIAQNLQQRQLWQALFQSILSHISERSSREQLMVYQFFFTIINPFKPTQAIVDVAGVRGSGEAPTKIALELLYANPGTERMIPELFNLLALLLRNLLIITDTLQPTLFPISSSASPFVLKASSEDHTASSSSGAAPMLLPVTCMSEEEFDTRLNILFTSLVAYDSANKTETAITEPAYDAKTGRKIKPLTLSLYPPKLIEPVFKRAAPYSLSPSQQGKRTPLLWQPSPTPSLSVQESRDDDEEPSCCVCC